MDAFSGKHAVGLEPRLESGLPQNLTPDQLIARIASAKANIRFCGMGAAPEHAPGRFTSAR
jgi:hypothetical protein